MIRPVAAVLGAFAVVGLAGCGGTTPSPAAQPSSTPASVSPAPASSAPAPASSAKEAPPSLADSQRCHTSSLAGSVKPLDAAAGNRYAMLVLTNTSGQLCTMYGYGGLQLVDAQGNPTPPTDLKRIADPGPTLVTLKPGASASKKLHWTVVPAGNEPTTGPCQPAAAGAKVIPPDEFTPLSVVYDFGSVCSHGLIEGSAYYPA